jgi:hypothetical protein
MTAPRERSGWRWTVYRIATGPRFHGCRLIVWIAQLPVVVARPTLAQLVMYVTILSIAAGIESALTDWVEGWKFVAEDR